MTDQVVARQRLIPSATTFLVLLTLGILQTRSLAADRFSESDPMIQRLSLSNTSVLDGQDFRTALERLTSIGQLNLWLDRNTDPSQVIQAGTLGPTLYMALKQVAATQNCVVMPIANVVLVGRANWVDEVTLRIMSTPSSKKGPVINIDWDQLTTPTEALKMVSVASNSSVTKMPHDHWPEVKLTKIHRNIAEKLIRSQFIDAELAATNHAPLGQESSGQESPAAMISRPYELKTKTTTDVVRKFQTASPKSRVSSSTRGIIVEATTGEHRKLIDLLLSTGVGKSGADPNRDTFTLKKMTTSAENAFRQFAQTAGRECLIRQDAAAACKQMVTLQGENRTLKSFVDSIARQVGVRVIWQEKTIIVSIAP